MEGQRSECGWKMGGEECRGKSLKSKNVSHPHPHHCLTLSHSHPHTLTRSCLTTSHPHQVILTASHPHCLTASLPHTLTRSSSLPLGLAGGRPTLMAPYPLSLRCCFWLITTVPLGGDQHNHVGHMTIYVTSTVWSCDQTGHGHGTKSDTG